MQSRFSRLGAGRHSRRMLVVLFVAVLMPCFAMGLNFLTDLNGWWRVLEDNDHLVKIFHQDTDVTLFDGDGALIAEGTLSDDTVYFFISPADTLIFIYHADTLSGHNEEGDPLTLVRFPVDLNGWWKDLVNGNFMALAQQGSVVTFRDMDSVYMGEGTFANDTLAIPMPPEMTDTLILVYAADTLRGVDLDSTLMILARSPLGPWPPIQCGTIVVDGSTDDWPESFLIAADPDNDGTSGPAAELDCLYLCSDSAYLYIRIDVVGDVAFPHSGGSGDRYSILLGRERYQQAEYLIRFWDTFAINFRNNVTAQETTLEAPGISGHTMEGRIPLYLLEYIDTAYISVESAYYDWEFGWMYYDRIDQSAVRQGCIPGDANGDGSVNVGDAVFLINYVFKSGPAPDPLCTGDANGDDSINVGDAVYLINYVFKSGPPPVTPCCP